jgi:electron transfer flavoprotein beta subunit
VELPGRWQGRRAASLVNAPPVQVGVALKWAPRRVDVDPLDGSPRTGSALWGMSDADAAALETGLVLAERWGGSVVAACAGPVEADGMLREALAAGAVRAVRVDPGSAAARLPGSPSSVAWTAAQLARALPECAVVVFGDYSPDGGSGAVPALYAAAVGAAQALGLVAVEAEAVPGAVRAERRLDRGRRERLGLHAPAVLSVEPSAARLRRAPLAGVLAAQSGEIAVLAAAPGERPEAVTLGPYRPRARALRGPDPGRTPRERVGDLLGLATPARERRELRVEPARAAAEILDQLRAWGYL